MQNSREKEGEIRRLSSMNNTKDQRKTNNRMRMTRALFKKIGDINGTSHARMGMIKYRDCKDLTEVEEIKKWQPEYTKEL